MQKRMIILTLLLTFLLTTLPLRAADPPNNKPGVPDLARVGTLLRISLANSSFEKGTSAPNKWTPLTQYIGNQYLWDNSVANIGQRSIAIRHTSYEYGRWMSDPIDVKKAGFSFYALTGKIKTSRNNGEVYLAIAWLDRNGHLINTSDSPMLTHGDNDWQTLTVNALPPDGTVDVSVWCISNNNEGITWFDDLKLTVTQFSAVGKGSYDQFLLEYPTHPLAVAANLMRVQELMTKAKWIREKGFYDPAAQQRASKLYAQAAGVQRRDSVLQRAVPASNLAGEQKRFEALIDKALWEAAVTAEASNDTEKVRTYLQQIVTRNKDAELKAAAQQWLSTLDQ